MKILNTKVLRGPNEEITSLLTKGILNAKAGSFIVVATDAVHQTIDYLTRQTRNETRIEAHQEK